MSQVGKVLNYCVLVCNWCAGSVYVSPTGQDGMFCGNRTHPCHTIQSGVDHCSWALHICEVVLMPGTYTAQNDTLVSLPPSLLLTGMGMLLLPYLPRLFSN